MAEKLTTKEKREQVLAAFRKLGTITHAAAAVGLDRRTVQRWKKSEKKVDKEFAEELKAIQEEQDDQAYKLIHDAIRNGDVDAAKWLLTRPGRRFHDNRRQVDLNARLTVAQEQHILILEETGRFLAAQMADPQRRARLLALQEAHERQP